MRPIRVYTDSMKNVQKSSFSRRVVQRVHKHKNSFMRVAYAVKYYDEI